MDDYIKSLQDNNDIFSGNKIFLTGKSGLAYGHYEALVEDLYSAKSSGLVHPDDLAEMKSAVNAARADYQAAMREQYPDFFTKQINDDMPRKTKEQAKQKEPAKTAKAAVEEKPVKEAKTMAEQRKEMAFTMPKKQYEEMKQKHPDSIILVRVGDFYETYGKDAVTASNVLGTTLTRSTFGEKGEKSSIERTGFPHHALDTYLPELVRAGHRVAICEQLDNQLSKTEVKSESKEARTEHKPREPQMVTVNGDRVSHGHAFQSKSNPENWYFTAKVNGVQLKPQKMSSEDLTAFQKKEIDVPGLMAKYYPTKVAERLPFDKIKADNVLEDGRTVDRFNVYKETREGPNQGKYMLFAQVAEEKVSGRASQQTLNAFFDRTETFAQMVTKNLGEQLHLASAYQKYTLPAEAGISNIRAVRNNDGHWYLNAKMDGKDMTGKLLDFNDGYSFFKAKTATAEQLAGKYFHQEISDKLNGVNLSQNVENKKSASQKLS